MDKKRGYSKFTPKSALGPSLGNLRFLAQISISSILIEFFLICNDSLDLNVRAFMKQANYQRKKNVQTKGNAAQRTSKPSAQASKSSGSKNAETHPLTTLAKSHSIPHQKTPIDSLQSLTAVSVQLDTLERKRDKSTRISDDKSLKIYPEATSKQHPTNAKKSKLSRGPYLIFRLIRPSSLKLNT